MAIDFKAQVAKLYKVTEAKKEMVRRNIMHAKVHCPCGGKNSLYISLAKARGGYHSRAKCEECNFAMME